jgi:biopolymer transport protein ExbD
MVDVRPDINVTLLVDVALVLLIILMVVPPHLEQDVLVDLPGVFNPDPDIETVRTLPGATIAPRSTTS